MLERFKYPIFGGLALAIAVGVLALLTYRPPPITLTIIPPLPTPTPGPLRVYVTGAVLRPQIVYQLPPGSRIEDAIRAAGGYTPQADQAVLNLAQPLRDGEHLHIPAQGERLAAAPSTQLTQTIRINLASAAELEQLPGVGPALARAIIAYRQQHGPFKTLSDLDKVPGVGPARLTQWAAWLSFD